MPPSRHDIVLRLLDGRSDQRELVLEGGLPIPPFVVGSRGPWRIDGSHVAGAHVMLAFNGKTLYVRAFRGEKALLDGAPLDGRWRESELPGELRFGSARVSIGRRAGPEDATVIPGDVVHATLMDEPDPEDEATTGIAGVRVERRPVSARSPREDEATCFDVDRLLAALVLSTKDEGSMPTVEVDMTRATSGSRSRGARSAADP